MRELPDAEHFSPLYLVFEIQPYCVAQVGLDFTTQHRMTLNLTILLS